MLNTMGLDDNTTELGQKEEGDGEHRAGDGDVGIKNTMVEAHHCDGKADTQSSYGEEENRQYAFSSSSTSPLPEAHVHHQLFHESVSAYGTLGKDNNMATYATSGEHAHENMAAYDTLRDHAQENMATQGTSGECAHENKIPYGTPREHMLENMAASFTADENVVAYGTLGGHVHDNMAAYATSVDHSHENMAAYGSLEQHVHENISANSDFGLDSMMTKGQLGGYAHETMSVSGNLGGFAQKNTSANGLTGEYAYEYMSGNGDLGGKVHDYMTAHGESERNAHENMLTNDESGGEDVKITLNFAVNSTNIPSLMNSATKTGCLLSASSYYNSQSSSIKKLEVMLRFGSAVFSLIAFSVMVSTNEKRIAAGSTFYVKFSDFKAYNYLVALNLLSFLYSSGQLIMFAQSKSSSILSSPIKWGALVYICDQMLAFLLVSSSSSAATASELSRHGLHNIWPPACSTWKLWLFCIKADGAIVMSFFSSLFVLLSSFSSGYHLSQLLAE